MPGKLWTKIIGPGYQGQVLTAGLLLTIVSLLMFAVISTLVPTTQPPTVEVSPVSEPMQAVQAGALNQEPVGTAAAIEEALPSVPSSELPAQATVTPASDMSTDNEAISDLWNGTVTHGFGWQLQPLYQDWRYHSGIDISGAEGQLVAALLSGEVVDIYTDKQYGLTVAVKSGKYTVYYGSLASVVVHKNTMIKTGKLIGSMGICTGEPEPHLHLAIQANDNQEYIDPSEIFPNILN